MNDFITGKSTLDTKPATKTIPSETVKAFQTLGLPISASWREVGAKYRELAKKYHPDTNNKKDDKGAEFTKISNAYQTLKSHFGK